MTEPGERGPDLIFSDPLLARLYDPLDGDRSDLDAYVAMVDEFGARSVLDVGCGTGTLACLLARRGIEVVGVDPAAASIDVARDKPGADRVRWLVGDVAVLPTLEVDLVTMTGNVAQVFCDDDAFVGALAACRSAVRVGGRLVFEVRDPSREAWRDWTREQSHQVIMVPGVGRVESWVDVLEVDLPLVRFRWSFLVDGRAMSSDSTLRFRTVPEIEACLDRAGWSVAEVRDAADRPGAEWVVVCS
jgi:SAM-dependent methyltransferase